MNDAIKAVLLDNGLLHCTVCNIVLTNENIYPRYIRCKTCMSKKQKLWRETHQELKKNIDHQYYLNHKDKIKKQATEWGKSHPERLREHKKTTNKNFIKNHPERYKELMKKWRTNNHEKVLQMNKACKLKKPELYKNLKRKVASKRRNMGHVQLNSPFSGCEGHHINKEHVVYIPSDVHKHFNHNHNKPETMIEINKAAFFYLMNEMMS